MASVPPFLSLSMATNMLCSEMFPIKETHDLQGAALYGIWSNGAQRVNLSQKRRCQARKQGVENWRSLPLPNWNLFLPPDKPFHWLGINCFQRNYKFPIARCSGDKSAIIFQLFEATTSSPPAPQRQNIIAWSVPFLNPYIKTLTPSSLVFGNGTFGR